MQWIFALTLLFILLEYSYARYKGLQIYSRRECFITGLTFAANYLLGVYAKDIGPYIPMSASQVYQFFCTHFRIPMFYNFTWMGPEWLRLIVVFLALDFVYYSSHRLAHKVNFFWAGHFTHHTITSLNIVNAHRDPIRLMKIGPTLVWIPVAAQVSGDVRGEVFALFLWISVYSTWIHCSFIPRIGWLEWIFNTPSSHRVHHSLTNGHRTMSVNYGGVLIIWDRLFGTYLAENETKHVYGVPGFTQSDRLWPVLFHQWVQYFKSLYQLLLNLRLGRSKHLVDAHVNANLALLKKTHSCIMMEGAGGANGNGRP